MKKDTFYFSHDYNTRTDEKIKLLIRKHGLLGYGIFWAIIEDLYNNANALRWDYEGIAFELRVQTEVVYSVINDFNLFVFDGEIFGSLSVQERLDERNKKSLKASESAFKRWSKDANVMQSQCERIEKECEGNAIKERKGKEIKENIIDNIKKYSLVANELNVFCLQYFEKSYINLSSLKMFDILLKKYSKEQIEKAITVAKTDKFWKFQFLSPLKLNNSNNDKVKYIDVFLNLKQNESNIGNNKGQQFSNEQFIIDHAKGLHNNVDEPVLEF